ncbi:MAG: hypothetical protein LC098_09665 [Burkholderiales bacterium]|nr:hypothetical protein [Burkholderiales bacterium]
MTPRRRGAYVALACAAAFAGATSSHAQSDPNIVLARNTQPGATGLADANGRSADTWLRDGDRVYVAFSPYTEHFRHNPEYTKHSYLVDLGIQSQYDKVWGSDATLFGLAVFKNSYGQPSQYIYWGQQWDIKPWLYAKVTAGLLHGYKGKYKNNIPFNRAGVAPGIIPSLGVRYGNFHAEGIVLGFSALMFTVGYTF